MSRLPTLLRRPRSRGQAVVEFAIIGALMLIILSTVLDLGRVFYTQITVENAARAGALVAARAPNSYTGACPTGSSPTNMIGCAIAAESKGSAVTIAPSEITVSCETKAGAPVNPCPSVPAPATRSRVAIVKGFTFLMPVLGFVFGSSINVSGDVAIDQQALPAAATFIPIPSATPLPTATPIPTATAAPTATATAAPTATPAVTPAPCADGLAPMPDLVVGATPGSTETVAQARAEWLTAGFVPANFNPQNGQNNKIVNGQGALIVGQCYPVATTTVTVTFS